MSILVYSDKIDLYPELATAAEIIRSSFNGEIIGVIIGNNNARRADQLKKIGLSKLVIFPASELNEYNPLAYLRALRQVIDEFNVKYVLMNTSYRNKTLGGLISSYMNSALVVDVTDLAIEKERIIASRAVYAGKALAKEEITGDKAVVLVKPGVFKPKEPISGECEVIEKEIRLDNINLKLVNFAPKTVEEGIRLDEADIVIGGGRGIRKKEDLEMLKKLANILNGAWGLSRPPAADYGWASEWIGISGISIRPKLYIAIGISGQPQHIAGIRESKIIVAVNNDAEAPIFQFSDYGIIGDLYQVVPKLIEKLKSIREG